MPVDVESELARLGSAWSESTAPVDLAEVLERTMATRSQPIGLTVDPPANVRHRMRSEPGPHGSGQRWLIAAACTALVVAGVVAVAQRPTGGLYPAATHPATTPTSLPTDDVAPLPPPEPFVGIWVSTDTDGSSQTMEIVRSGTDGYKVLVHDDAATGACAGAPATMTGTALLETDETLVIAQPALTCDDGTTPRIGAPPQAELADFTLELDAASEEFVDRFGIVWRRPGSTGTGNTASPTTAVEPATAADAATLAERQAVVDRLIDAVNGAVVGDDVDLTSIRGLFTENATIRAFSNWAQSPVAEPGLLERWILQLRTWGFDGAEAYWENCLPSEDVEGRSVYCSMRARWGTLLAEADEEWEVEFVGDKIHTLVVGVWGGAERSSVTLPLAVADLAYWEQWLHETDPETAARLLPSVEFEEDPGVTRYDPTVAAEINASIQAYVENRPPGDEISVTADLVEVGDRLVTVSMARADGRRYVLAGRYQTGRDLEVAFAEQAVLAAFDDVGRELWRTELGGRPTEIAVVDDALWVSSLADDRNLTRIASSDGRVLGHVTNGGAWDMVGAFGSLWVQEQGGQLVRVNPDLSTTTVEGPFPDLTNGCDYCPDGLTAGSDAIWVPLGNLGVAVIDAVTNQVTTIPPDEIGHDVLKVAFDGEVTYVASRNRVTSIVDGQVRATVTVGEILYLGPVDGVIGAQLLGDPPGNGRFVVLRADNPMVIERPLTSGGAQYLTNGGAQYQIDGEAWEHVWTGRKPDFRRVELLPVPEGNGRGPVAPD